MVGRITLLGILTNMESIQSKAGIGWPFLNRLVHHLPILISPSAGGRSCGVLIYLLKLKYLFGELFGMLYLPFTTSGKKKIVAFPRCPSCAAPVESVAHAIFWCKRAVNCWGCSKFGGFFEEVQQLPADEVLLFASSNLSIEDLGGFCMIAWAIWGNRNNLCNTGMSKPSELVESGAGTLLAEFQQSKRALSTLAPTVHPRTGSDWLAPPPGQFKLNTAAARRNKGLSIGIGAAIRDDKGLVIAARANQLPGRFTEEVGELIALREGLQLAHFYNLKVNLVEVMSHRVVSVLNDSIPLVGESKYVMNDINLLISIVGISKCLAVSKSGNSLALSLANSAFSSCSEWLWMDGWS